MAFRIFPSIFFGVSAILFINAIHPTTAAVVKTYKICVGANLANQQICHLNYTMTVQSALYAVASCGNSTSNCCPSNPIICFNPIWQSNPAYYQDIKTACDGKQVCSSLEVKSAPAVPAQCDGANITNLMEVRVLCVPPPTVTPAPYTSSLSPGAIFGIVIACLVLVAALILASLYLWTEKKMPAFCYRDDGTSAAAEGSSVPYSNMTEPSQIATTGGESAARYPPPNQPARSARYEASGQAATETQEKLPGNMPPDFYNATYASMNYSSGSVS